MAFANKDTPIGHDLPGVTKQVLIQLMGTRHWGRMDPIHYDAATAVKLGFKAPVQTGEMCSAYLSEMCVNFFGASFFRDGQIECKYVKPVYAGETITTYGRVIEKTTKGQGYRFKVEIRAENQEGETKTVGWAKADVET